MKIIPGVLKIDLDTQNPVNLSFYEKMGFEVVGHVYCKDKNTDNYYLVRNPQRK